VCFWDSLIAVRVVPAADGVIFGVVAAFTLPVAAPRVGVGPAAAFVLLVVPAAGAGAPAPLALPGGPLVAAGGVSGA